MTTVGLDEVGRGCWAGPLVAGAVILPDDYRLGESIVLRDSKKMTRFQRKRTSEWILVNAVAVGIGWVEPLEIDTLGLSKSVALAFKRALEAIHAPYNDIIIDGNINYLNHSHKSRAVIKADDIFPCVSAASIVAKVARDEYMAKVALSYKGYGFEDHVGYGTAMHKIALMKLGVSDIHRRSFKPIQRMLN